MPAIHRPHLRQASRWRRGALPAWRRVALQTLDGGYLEDIRDGIADCQFGWSVAAFLVVVLGEGDEGIAAARAGCAPC